MYKDGTNLDAKREKYNSARDEASYISHGPVALPKIPVMATWDDHDYASNNLGNDYPCKLESQDEFVTHFNIPESDPRHKNYRLFFIKPKILESIFYIQKIIDIREWGWLVILITILTGSSPDKKIGHEKGKY